MVRYYPCWMKLEHEDEWKREDRQILWEDKAIIGKAQEWKKVIEKAATRQSALFERMRKLEASLEQAWEKEQEEREYTRFLEDYQDVDLWEGHRKTLKLAEMPNGREVRVLTEILVESDIDPIGMSVLMALEVAVKKIGVTNIKAKEDENVEETLARWHRESKALPSAEALASVAHLRYAKTK